MFYIIGREREALRGNLEAQVLLHRDILRTLDPDMCHS